MKYAYAKGRLLDVPNTYFYTPYYGMEFIKAWKTERLRILKVSGKPVKTGGSIKSPRDRREDIEILLRQLVRKFEITKRIYTSYRNGLRPADGAGYKDYELYLKTAGLFEAAYAKFKKLIYLNAFLKIMDTLCSISHNLNKRQKQRLAWLILRESRHVSALGRTAGVYI